MPYYDDEWGNKDPFDKEIEDKYWKEQQRKSYEAQEKARRSRETSSRNFFESLLMLLSGKR